MRHYDNVPEIAGVREPRPVTMAQQIRYILKSGQRQKRRAAGLFLLDPTLRAAAMNSIDQNLALHVASIANSHANRNPF